MAAAAAPSAAPGLGPGPGPAAPLALTADTHPLPGAPSQQAAVAGTATAGGKSCRSEAKSGARCQASRQQQQRREEQSQSEPEPQSGRVCAARADSQSGQAGSQSAHRPPGPARSLHHQQQQAARSGARAGQQQQRGREEAAAAPAAGNRRQSLENSSDGEPLSRMDSEDRYLSVYGKVAKYTTHRLLVRAGCRGTCLHIVETNRLSVLLVGVLLALHLKVALLVMYLHTSASKALEKSLVSRRSRRSRLLKQL